MTPRRGARGQEEETMSEVTEAQLEDIQALFVHTPEA
jgi:hypothetical protein